MNLIQFNGEEIPSPLPFSVTIADQDLNSAVDANGDLHRNRVNVKRKISLEWGPLSWSDLSKILKTVQTVFFKCTYPDPESGRFETKTFYVSDRTMPICLVENNELIWQGLTLDIVEQ